MTYYYSHASLNYSILNIIIRWCIFYCVWNLWTLPRLESHEHIDVSMRVPGNSTILQESLPVHMINGRRTVLISGLLRQTFSTAKADGMESIAHSATKPTALAIPDSRMQSRKEPREGPKSQHNKKPRKRKSVATKHRIPGRYQTSNMEIKTQGHAAINSKAATYQAKPRQSHSNTKPVARRLRNASLQSSLGVSAPIRQQQQQPQQRSIFVLLAFSCALVGGGMFGLRALKRLENWEIHSQEESLAYDFAFTTKRDSNYGSFEPQIWEGDLNKFDV